MLDIMSRKTIWDTVLKVLLEFKKKKKKNRICSFFWSIRWLFPSIFCLLWVIIDLSIWHWMAWVFPMNTQFIVHEKVFPMLLHMSWLPQNWRPDPHVLGMDWVFFGIFAWRSTVFSLCWELFCSYSAYLSVCFSRY